MTTIAELETEQGPLLYLNPHHVVSIIGVADAEPPISVVTVATGAFWRVRGAARGVADHLLAEAIEGVLHIARLNRKL